MLTLEQQVTSLELSKRLHELGVLSESLFCWFRKPYLDEVFEISLTVETYYKDSERYSAFTASELLELLPKSNEKYVISIYKYGDYQCCYEEIFNNYKILINVEFDIDSMANVLAKMLIHLIENKLLEIK